MSNEITSEGNRELVAQVLDELDRSHVVCQSADELASATELTDSTRGIRQPATERESMLRQLPVE
jgi:hypothetical protein